MAPGARWVLVYTSLWKNMRRCSTFSDTNLFTPPWSGFCPILHEFYLFFLRGVSSKEIWDGKLGSNFGIHVAI